MPIPNPNERFGRFRVGRIKFEVCAVHTGEDCTSYIRSSVAWELGLAYNFRDAFITIEVEAKKITMVIAVSPSLSQKLVLGTDFLYLLHYWSSRELRLPKAFT